MPLTPPCSLTFGTDIDYSLKTSEPIRKSSNDSGYGASAKQPAANIQPRDGRNNKPCPSSDDDDSNNDGDDNNNNKKSPLQSLPFNVNNTHRPSWGLGNDLPELKRYDSGFSEDIQSEGDQPKLDKPEESDKQLVSCDRTESSVSILNPHPGEDDRQLVSHDKTGSTSGICALSPDTKELKAQIVQETRAQLLIGYSNEAQLQKDDNEDFDDDEDPEDDDEDPEDDDEELSDEGEHELEHKHDHEHDDMFQKIPVMYYQTSYRGKWRSHSLLSDALEREPRLPYTPIPHPRRLRRMAQRLSPEQSLHRSRMAMSTVDEESVAYSRGDEAENIQDLFNVDEEDDVGAVEPNGESTLTTKLWSWWQTVKSMAMPANTSSVINTEHWEADESSNSCKFCFKHFTFTRRRHHCRVCGDLFCADCSSGMALLNPRTAEPAENGTYLGRVCANCHHNFRLDDEDWFTTCGVLGSAFLSSVEAIETRWNLRVSLDLVKALMMTKK